MRGTPWPLIGRADELGVLGRRWRPARWSSALRVGKTAGGRGRPASTPSRPLPPARPRGSSAGPGSAGAAPRTAGGHRPPCRPQPARRRTGLRPVGPRRSQDAVGAQAIPLSRSFGPVPIGRRARTGGPPRRSPRARPALGRAGTSAAGGRRCPVARPGVGRRRPPARARPRHPPARHRPSGRAARPEIVQLYADDLLARAELAGLDDDAVRRLLVTVLDGPVESRPWPTWCGSARATCCTSGSWCSARSRPGCWSRSSACGASPGPSPHPSPHRDRRRPPAGPIPPPVTRSRWWPSPARWSCLLLGLADLRWSSRSARRSPRGHADRPHTRVDTPIAGSVGPGIVGVERSSAARRCCADPGARPSTHRPQSGPGH
jgi:hypothetical protein